MISTKDIKKLVWFSIIFFAYNILNAQEAKPFKPLTEFYIYGDAVAIGNNILSKDAKEPCNDLTLANDDIDMVYVDVDDNSSTFSSSSANLLLPKNQTEIVYAALYWSSTYSYEKGTKKESGNNFYFQGKRPKNRSVDKIQFKLPNESYVDITGDIIFDGAKQRSFSLNSPYACYANVTSLLKKAKTINGEYTVANIKASEGFVSGGSASGWMLYVVYEAPTENPKYITTYNGFAHVGNKPVEIDFKNFKTVEEGETKTALTFAALEGDAALDKDQCIVINPKTSNRIVLSDDNRASDNFFNSKITNKSKTSTRRSPNSSNTLGFDISTLELSSTNKTIIDKNTKAIKLAFNTKSDRFYLFFTAFQTEISKTFYEEKVPQKPKKEKQLIVLKEEKPKEKAKEALEEKVISRPKINKPKPIKTVEVKKEELKKVEPKKIEAKRIEPKKVVVQETKQLEAFKPKKTLKQPIKNDASTSKKTPIWLQKSGSKDLSQNTNTATNLNLKKSKYIGDFLALSRENYKDLLVPDDYIYETQTFKKIYNQKQTSIEGIPSGYYIILSITKDSKEAIDLQYDLRIKGINSNIIQDPINANFYQYIFTSTNFYDTFMQRKAFVKNDILKNCWIININMK